MNQLFLGNEQMTVDNKGRVGIPARFMTVLRAICPDAADRIGVMITPERSLKLMPAPYFTAELGRWSGLNDQIDNERMVLNLSTSMAEMLPLDQQNRFKLNALMMKLCNIHKDVVIVGSMKYMQLFDVKTLEEMIDRGLPLWGTASTQVAQKGQGPAPVQYVINAPGSVNG